MYLWTHLRTTVKLIVQILIKYMFILLLLFIKWQNDITDMDVKLFNIQLTSLIGFNPL